MNRRFVAALPGRSVGRSSGSDDWPDPFEVDKDALFCPASFQGKPGKPRPSSDFWALAIKLEVKPPAWAGEALQCRKQLA